jgi:NarL family two-component system sensor histidine kinase LiaS
MSFDSIHRRTRFSEVLKKYGAEWSQRSGIELKTNVEEGEELSLETREILFRIAQEALANVARHSSASSTELSLEYGAKTVTLMISDNGRGFDTSLAHRGIGLRSMQSAQK